MVDILTLLTGLALLAVSVLILRCLGVIALDQREQTTLLKDRLAAGSQVLPVSQIMQSGEGRALLRRRLAERVAAKEGTV